MAKVKAVKAHFHGHTSVETEDGKVTWLTRGKLVPAVGDEFSTAVPTVPAGVQSFLDADAD